MLGKLKRVDLRTVWKHEASDFTTWLSQEENLTLLGDEVGIDLKFIQVTADVGDFKLDILAEEENTGRKVVIENQLEQTDHDHLGKLMTYAAGHDAQIAIWVAREIRDEHRQAMDWINQHTDGEMNLFAVEIELWQIGDSPCAPRFRVVSRPNDWARLVRESAEHGTLSATKEAQLEFWNSFKEYARDRKTSLRLRKAYPQHWYDISYGSSESHISLSVNTQSDLLGCEIWISDSKGLFHHLLASKEPIERELGERLEWMPLPTKKASRIKLSREGTLGNRNAWNEYFDWFKKKAEAFQTVFAKHSKHWAVSPEETR